MELLLVFLLIYYFIELTRHHLDFSNSIEIKGCTVGEIQYDIKSMFSNAMLKKEVLNTIPTLLLDAIILALEIVYIFWALQNGHIIITFLYLLFLISYIKFLTISLTTKSKILIKHHNFLVWFKCLVSLSYFVYMYYIKFLV